MLRGERRLTACGEMCSARPRNDVHEPDSNENRPERVNALPETYGEAQATLGLQWNASCLSQAVMRVSGHV